MLRTSWGPHKPLVRRSCAGNLGLRPALVGKVAQDATVGMIRENVFIVGIHLTLQRTFILYIWSKEMEIEDIKVVSGGFAKSVPLLYEIFLGPICKGSLEFWEIQTFLQIPKHSINTDTRLEET